MAIVDIARLRRAARSLVVLLLPACALLNRGQRTTFESREIAVYRTIAESLYLTKAAGRSIGIIAQVLDTACTQGACDTLERRWGLDSLWWSQDDRALAARMKGALLSQAGLHLAFGPEGVGHERITMFEPGGVPSLNADSAAWRRFQDGSGAVALLRFSPVGFSPDGKRALVVVEMRSGPSRGHWLGASLRLNGKAWALGDVLLVSSVRR